MIESIVFKQISFGFRRTDLLFENFSCDIPLGKKVALHAGAHRGRSTFLRLMAGLEHPSLGQVLINGQNIASMSFDQFLPVRKKIGYSFDFGGLIANRTLWQNLMLPLEYHRDLSPSAASEFVAQFCQSFGIWDVRDLRPANVSGGARKACVVARAFVMNPELVLLDDPFVALDQRARLALIDLLNADHGPKHQFIAMSDPAHYKFLNYDTELWIGNQCLELHEAAQRVVA